MISHSWFLQSPFVAINTAEREVCVVLGTRRRSWKSDKAGRIMLQNISISQVLINKALFLTLYFTTQN